MEARQLLTVEFSSLAGFGASGTLVPAGVAIDASGNTLVTGSFSGKTSLDTTAAGQAQGFTDIYVAKYGQTGNLLWFRHYGNNIGDGSGSSAGQGIGVDSSGNVFVTGYYSGRVDFDPAHAGTHTLSTFDGINAFVLKLDSNGNFGSSSYAIGTQGSSGAVNQGSGLAVDATGTVTVTGSFEAAIAFQGSTLAAAASQEPFVARVGPSGNLIYLRSFTGTANTQNNYGNAVSLDSAGNAYIAGTFRASMAFSASAILTSTNDSSKAPTNDAFVVKLDPSGATVYAKAFGGVAQDEATGIASDSTGKVDVIGRFGGSVTFSTGTITTSKASDLFVTQLSPTGQTNFAVALGLLNSVQSHDKPGIVLDSAGNGFAAASFQGSGTIGLTTIASSGSNDVFVAKISPTGSLLYATRAGGTGSDAATGIARNALGQFALGGPVTPPATFGGGSVASQGAANAYIAQFLDIVTTTTPGKKVAGDFDGDGKTDEAVFDPVTATYYIRYSTGGALVKQFGIPNGKDQPVAGDFDGDGKTDLAVFDPPTATYYILYSGGGSRVQQFGIPNGKDFMVPGDFDGDGKTDEAIFDPPTATYYIRYSGGGSRVQQFGVPNGQNLMVAGDYDGDGKTDEAVFDPVTATYYIRYSGGGSLVQQFGIPNANNQPVAGDFDGDGKTDLVVFAPGTATYYIRYSGGGSKVQQFGVPNGKGIMTFGDYDGDKKTDETVFDPTNATYYTRFSAGGSRVEQFGVPNGKGIPVPAVVRPVSTGGGIGIKSVNSGQSDFVALADNTSTPTILVTGKKHPRRHPVRRFGVGV